MTDSQVAAVLPDLQAAHRQCLSGCLDEAESLCTAVLQRIPDYGVALHLLGEIALAKGNAAWAADLIVRALEDLPEDLAEPHVTLGTAWVTAGHTARAEVSYRAALDRDPACGVALVNLAALLNARAAHEEALALALRAAPLVPELPQANLNAALALIGLHREAEGEAPLRQVLALDPDHVEALRALARVLRRLNRPREALQPIERAVALQQPHPQPQVLLELGATLEQIGEAERALHTHREALTLAPGLADAWVAAARAERQLGHFDEASRCLRQALSIVPDLAEAYWQLAAGRALTAADLDSLQAMLTRQDLPEASRIVALYALGTAMDDADRYADAFKCIGEANARFRAARANQGQRFDGAAYRRHVDQLIRRFPADSFHHRLAWGNGSELPVFVVGMPRSGTTLVEQIIASHTLVLGAGELAEMPLLVHRLRQHNRGRRRLGEWDAAHARQLADGHVRLLTELAGTRGVARVVDKLPDNIGYLGHIAALFPRARIILVNRDPRDIGLSNFFQFYRSGNLFACDLADCGLRVAETTRLARHWLSVLPGHVLSLDYEALVADPEREARRLIEFLGLEWQPACLEFHRTERAVSTPSMWQVRQPISRRSVGRWRLYAPHLAPMLDRIAATA